jgi:RNA polymerase sigma factor (TIGR02999 family)
MGDAANPGITDLLRAWGAGDQAALNRLAPLVQEELHRVAHRYMRDEGPGHTLQTTALVNEAFVRLVEGAAVDWKDRAHFFAVSAQTMRRILVDSARARVTEKRGGGRPQLSLDEALDGQPARAGELVELDEALDELAELDPRKVRVVELRFFGGLSVEETAEVLKVSAKTVLRDWNMARAWLSRELSRKRTA